MVRFGRDAVAIEGMDCTRKGYRRRVGRKVGRSDSGVFAAREDEGREPRPLCFCVDGVVGLDQAEIEA